MNDIIFPQKKALSSISVLFQIILFLILFTGTANAQEEGKILVKPIPEPQYNLGPQLVPSSYHFQRKIPFYKPDSWRNETIDTSVYKLLPQENRKSLLPVNIGFDNQIVPQVAQSECTNSDFSLGNFTNWIGCYGTWNLSYIDPCSVPSHVWHDIPTGGHFSIQNPGNDPCISVITKVFPGDAHSALIGNRTCSQGGGGYIDKLTYQIAYDPGNSFFIYRCAVILENPTDQTHNTADKRPRFTFEIKDDATQTLIDPVCGYYDLWPADGITNWLTGPGDFLYKDWSTIGIDLNVLPGLTTGQLLDVVFTVHGCAYTAHTAYAYISAFCGSMSIQNTGCNGSGSITMTGPPGFTTYQWQGPYCPLCPPNPPTYTGNPITITAAQGAITGNTFSLTLTALNGCQVQNVQQIIAFTTIDAYFTDTLACAQRPSNFYDTSIVSQNSVTAWRWFFGNPASGASDSSHLKNPTHSFTAPGTYTVKLISYSTEGCPDTISKQVVIDTLIAINNTTSRTLICSNHHTNINLTTNLPNALYTWTATASSVNISGYSGNAIPALSPIDQILVNTGTQRDSVTYIITPHNGTCAGDPFTFRVVVLPNPTATVTGTITVCQNAASPVITFTGASGTAPYTFTYHINGLPKQTVTTTVGNSVTVTAPTNVTGIFTYNLDSIQEGSSNACSHVQTGSVVVTVNPLPTATITGTITVCKDSPPPLITFTGASATPPYTFTYNINGGANQLVTTTVGNSVTIAAPTNVVGTFTYSLVSVQDGSPTTCSQAQTGSAVVNVNPLPTATITGTIAVCKNSPPPLITFTGASSTAPYTFTYNINGLPNSTVTTSVGNSVTIAAPTNVVGIFTYTLVSVQDGSTTLCSQAQAGSVVVTVNSLPIPVITGSQAVCLNSTTVYGTAAGMTNYFWTVSAGGTITGGQGTNTLSVNWTSNGAQTVTVNYNDANGCTAASPSVWDIVVSNLPTPGLAGTTTLCVGSIITYTTDPGNSAYVWLVSAGGTPTAGGGPNDNFVTVHWTVAAPQTISVNYQAGPGCSASSPHVENVTVNPLPTATISGTISVCQNSAPPLITFTGASATAPYTFTYNINGLPNSTVTTVVGNSVTVAAPTNIVGAFTYNLVSVQDGSLTTCSQVQSGSVIVTVNPLPTATITGAMVVCQNSASPLITFTGASSTAPYTFTYNINGLPNQTVTTVVGNSVTVAAPTNVVGTFTYNLVSVQDGSSTTCSQAQSGSVIVTVNPLPTATIAGTIAVCQNSASPLITFTGASSTAPYTFTYNINGLPNSTVTTAVGNSVTVAAPTNVVGSFTYNLVSVQDGSSTTCSQAQSGSVIVTVNPLPTATIAGTIAVCQNSASPLITFTGASSTAPYTFTYNINGLPNSTVTTAVGNSVTVAAPTNVVGSFTYNLVSVQDGSSTTCSQAQSGSVIVTVNPLPTATISGTIAVCQNSASPLITFTGASSTAPYTFTYNINGLPNSTVTTAVGNSVTVAAPTNVVGSFTYNLVSVQDGSSTTCSQAQSGSVIVTVNPLPTATIAGTITVCKNSASPLISFTGASATPPYTFTYNINGLPNSTVTTTVGNSVTVAAPTNVVGSFTYNLVSVQDGSPTTCSQAQSGSVIVTVNPLPTATIAGTITVCQNLPSPLITFTGASSTAPYTFTYNINGLPNQTVTTIVGNSVTVAAPTNILGIFTYTLVSVQDGSSTTCSQVQAGSAVVTVSILPTPTITGLNTICSGFSTTYTTQPGMNNYSWSVSAGGTVIAGGGTSDNTVTVLWNAAGPQTVSANYVMGTGCTATSPTVYNVTVHSLPVPTLSGTQVLCAGPTTYVYSTQNGMSAYQWTVSAGGTVTAGGGNSDNSVTVKWLTAGPQTVTVNYHDANGCTALVSTSYPVTVNPLPVPAISGAASVCVNSTSTYFTDAGMTNYIWTVSAGGSITAGTGSNSITVQWNTIGSKTIQVNYIDANGCTAPSPTSYAVTVNFLPVPGLAGLNSLCSGLSTVYTTDPGMNNYSWIVSAGGSIIAGGGTSDNTVTVLWNTAGAQTVSVNYVMGTGCTATQPTVYNVTIKPRPSVTNPANSTICSNTFIGIPLFANLPGTTFSWTATGSSPSVTGFHPGAGFSITDNLINTGSNIETVNYAVTPTLNGCDGAVAHYIVTVNPVADVYFNPNGQSFCSGGITTINILSHVAGATFTWTATGSSGFVSGYGPGVTNYINQTLTNSGPYFENVNYHVFPLANTCPGTDNHVIVNMNPTPQVSFDMACNDLITTTDAKAFTLRGGIPLGGVYSGPGVNAGIFYPSLAGAGTITINYSYSNTWGCNANQSQILSVISMAPFNCDNILTDIRDNKQYPTIKIGTQCWMAMNLDLGTQIPSTSIQHDNCIVEKYCNGDIAGNCATMGGLYQWDEMMRFQDIAAVQGICPPGWHVPTENDWTTLFGFYISNGFAGSPLKFSGYSGYNAWLNGVRFDNTLYDFTNFATFFWSSNSDGPSKAWAHGMNTNNPSVSYYPGNRSNAFSIRCIKD